jgi:hypothetical protein
MGDRSAGLFLANSAGYAHLDASCGLKDMADR